MRKECAWAFGLGIFVFALPCAAAKQSFSIRVVDVVPASLSAEESQDSESTIAVDPLDPNYIAVSAFSPDPARSRNSSIYYTADGGKNWILSVMVPGAMSSLTYSTMDISLQFLGHVLYAAILNGTYSPNYHFELARKTNLATPGLMELVGPPESGLDQPWLTAVRSASGGRGIATHFFISSNDIQRTPDTATVALPRKGSGSATQALLSLFPVEQEEDVIGGQDLPSVRTAPAPDGTVYEAHIRLLNQADPSTANVVVRRDDAWGTRGFQSLKAAKGLPRVLVAPEITVPQLLGYDSYLGCERVSSALSLAVDPRNSKVVYIAWGDGEAASFRLHVARSDSGGLHWKILATKGMSVNPALAVNSDGVLGFLYQSLDAGSGNRLLSTEDALSITPAELCQSKSSSHIGGSWSTYFETTSDSFKTVSHRDLVRHAPEILPDAFDPEIGDFANLTSVGHTFYGAFSSGNDPALTLFPQGDPFQRFHQLRRLPGSLPSLFADVRHIRRVNPSVDPFVFIGSVAK